MTDTPETTRDYRDTVFLPKTDFPMKAGLPQKEPGILAKWQADGAYQQLRAARAGREKFILHDGPPYANGDMHIGHALNHILKDMVCRTQNLLGKDAPYVPGWDCHGLPIEWKVEEAYRKKKLNKDEVPAQEFRAECRAYAQGWVDTQREQLKRLGINGDWDHPYLTMDADAEATIVQELMKFATRGQLYRGAKPVMWSPVEKTALAEAEVEYEDIISTQIDVTFEIVESPISELVGAHAVIWTTTPWTIPVNQALAYGPEVEYVVIQAGGRRYVLAEYLVKQLASRAIASGADEETWTFPPAKQKNWFRLMGSDLAGTIARHPMHHLGGFFAKPRPFLPGDFVTTEQGTGLVHMAPDHGEDDFDLCKANGIDAVFAVEGDGKYRADWAWLGGQGSVINAKFTAPDGPICEDLRAAGALLAASSDYKHSYPHSWRSKAKVIFRATPQWFIPVDAPLNPLHFVERAGSEASRERNDVEAGVPLPTATQSPSPQGGEGSSLRQTALSAIAATRFVPEKGRNRIGSMVEGRPDWVISRQRAWGVPITLFVKKGTNQYLTDPAVNARIVDAIRVAGVDGWSAEAAPALLGPDYDVADYEQVTDILDVWFDSGCTHAFVLESGKWPDMRWPADLYLEGSDQHRGWFQSSLLESCGTRGRAPYDAVLTHGFTMDQKGMKMSKSLGNTINPLDLMRDYGADILRLWALSVDFTEDHRIGKEILSGVADQYRKVRNTFRYLLGALEGFSEDERVPVADMPELERYILHLLADMDAKLKQAVDDFDFNSYTRLLSDFANNDLGEFYFDIRKDALYCDVGPALPHGSHKRRAYRTVLDILFHALVRYAAPVLVFTSEEVWGTRFSALGSVHLLEWPDVKFEWLDLSSSEDWNTRRVARRASNYAIEQLRKDKRVGSGNAANVEVKQKSAIFEFEDMAEVFMTAPALIDEDKVGRIWEPWSGPWITDITSEFSVRVRPTAFHKCGRCWRHLPEVTEDGALCGRCAEVVA
ncbi:isoleucine--tRNA ligase [Sphingomonas sp. SUN039]|uniref:isoleucine--tRNA ligase n=1 Tax=Sphingomonas sp. SUN039 TaxID=2937787 RepID=UPI00216492CB|nr:isoleucine--tRNA ligase [Sphingomonas sp. SUN039]UVO55596.1 isoleucine--tRNA ligase [Sphingomonas sp. SUN039]